MSTATDWPRAEVSLSSEGRAHVNLEGVEMDLSQPTPQEARAAIVAHLSDRAKALECPISTTITDPAGSWRVAIYPDGAVITEGAPTPAPHPVSSPPTAPALVSSPPDPLSPMTPPTPTRRQAHAAAPPATQFPQSPQSPAAPPPPTRRRQRSAPAPAPDTATPETAGIRLPPEVPPQLDDTLDTRIAPRSHRAEPAHPEPVVEAPIEAAPAPVDPRSRARSTSLLVEVTNEAPAATGWRGILNQFGLHLAPAARERAERADAAAVSQHWAGPRTIAVVNGKGGASKTPTTILLAAIFARYGGAGVVAYDNNSTRGTLGWRTQQGPHEATVIDMLPHVRHLLSPQAQAAEISGFVHHQREDRYDVLRSRPEVLADQNPGDAESFEAVHEVLTKYYRLVVVDSGNDESAPQWRAMISRADAIVVPTITQPDHAESARLLLAELAGADAHAAQLAENALVIVSQSSKAEPRPDELVATFSGIARAAVGIPYDPAMGGRPLILDSLAPATRRAWLTAGTALAAGLA